MRITNMQRYGERGWQWVQEDREWHTGRVVREEYRTNGDGAGLWRETYNAYGSYEGWRQIVGTAQFHAGRTERAVRRAIHRYALLGEPC